MSDDLTIRRYRDADAERVWEIHEAALRASPIAFVEDAPADEDITEITAAYLDPGGEFLVGVTEGALVAMGGFQPRADDVAKIRRMRVHPEYQRRGYGKRMLRALEGRAEDRGFERVVLDTNEQLSAARKLYENAGYEETRREPHPATGDAFVYYEKPL